jgi:hypothetical protein
MKNTRPRLDWQPRRVLGLLAASVLVGLFGCTADRRGEPPAAVQVVLVPPAQTNEATGTFMELAREAFPGAEVYPALSRLTRPGRRYVLLVLQPAQLDPVQWPALEQSLKAGTPMLFWGCDPLQRLTNTTAASSAAQLLRHHFSSPAAHLRFLDNNESVPFPVRVQSPWPGSAGAIGNPPLAGRWIPLVETEDASGQGRAWPAALYVAQGASGRANPTWGWIGVEAEQKERDALLRLLRLCGKRLHDGAFFLQAGAHRAALDGGDRLEVTARVLSATNTAPSLRVVAELLEPGGRVSRRVSAAAQELLTLNLGTLPRLPDRSRDQVLRISLWSADDQQRFDQIEQPLRILPTQRPPQVERVGVTGSGFTLGRRPLFIFGAPLHLHASAGWTGQGAEIQPLDPEVFTVSGARREIALAQEAGLNVFSLTLEHEQQIPQLRWLLEELRPRSMWIHLRVAGLDPLALDLPRARRLLETSRVLEDPLLFALEIGPRGPLGHEEQRRSLDPAWHLWLLEQYGDLQHAEQELGQPLWRWNNTVTGPPDEQLAHDGEHRRAVAVYRRFVDDWFSRQYGQIRRFLNEQGCRALVSARSSWGGPPEEGPMDPASGAVHLDFVTLDSNGLADDPAARAAAAFSTVYARGMTLGKPVLWMNLGSAVEPQASRAQKAAQAERVQALLSMMLQSHAAGVLLRPLPGGGQPERGTDTGFTEPDGRWRPAGDVLRRFTLRIRREATAPLSWRGQIMDRDGDARGLYGLLQTLGETYRAEAGGDLLERRPLGAERTSLDMPDTTVGGGPHHDPAPWSMLNAEWGGVCSASQTVERVASAVVHGVVREKLDLALWNTGPARWIGGPSQRPGTIWVRVLPPEGREQWIPVTEALSGQRTGLHWTPADSGRWTLRPWRWGGGGFGEPLIVDVTEK